MANNWKELKKLFPEDIGNKKSAQLFNLGLSELKKNCQRNTSRILLKKEENVDNEEFFIKIPERGLKPEAVIKKVIQKFFNGIPNWRSPKLQYNICAPTKA